MFCHPIPGLDHPNFLSYIDVLRQDTNVGDRVSIIGAGGIGFDVRRWMEDLGVDGTNDSSAGVAAAVPSQWRRGRRQKRKRGGVRRIVLMKRKIRKLGNLGRTTG